MREEWECAAADKQNQHEARAPSGIITLSNKALKILPSYSLLHTSPPESWTGRDLGES
jgi:hypothetical protein